jgi:chromosome segregation ATPase
MKINWSFVKPVRDQAARLRGDYSAQSAIVKLAEQQAEIDRLRAEKEKAAEEMWKASDQAQRFREIISEQRSELHDLLKTCHKQSEEIARLREVLKPFGQLFLYPDDLGFEPSEDIRADIDWDEDANDMQTENVFVLRRDIRAARAAIQEGGKDV